MGLTCACGSTREQWTVSVPTKRDAELLGQVSPCRHRGALPSEMAPCLRMAKCENEISKQPCGRMWLFCEEAPERG